MNYLIVYLVIGGIFSVAALDECEGLLDALAFIVFGALFGVALVVIMTCVSVWYEVPKWWGRRRLRA